MTIKPAVSILIPHLREKRNDAALQIALSCLVDNTGLDYELIVEAVDKRRDVYKVVNAMTRRAMADYVIVSNSDVFVAPGWLEPLYELRGETVIVAPVMVECGKIGVSPLNLHKDFGHSPETFDREAFEQFVIDGGEWREPDGRAWYWPSLHHRKTFLAFGGYDTTGVGFPYVPKDMVYWDKWEAAGRTFRRAKSWVYHLQFWSGEERQAKS